jgi:hypothetical protein
MVENGKAPSEESFQFIETPPAIVSETAVEDCGVRVTSVSKFIPLEAGNHILHSYHFLLYT